MPAVERGRAACLCVQWEECFNWRQGDNEPHHWVRRPEMWNGVRACPPHILTASSFQDGPLRREATHPNPLLDPVPVGPGLEKAPISVDNTLESLRIMFKDPGPTCPDRQSSTGANPTPVQSRF